MCKVWGLGPGLGFFGISGWSLWLNVIGIWSLRITIQTSCGLDSCRVKPLFFKVKDEGLAVGTVPPVDGTELPNSKLA